MTVSRAPTWCVATSPRHLPMDEFESGRTAMRPRRASLLRKVCATTHSAVFGVAVRNAPPRGEAAARQLVVELRTDKLILIP